MTMPKHEGGRKKGRPQSLAGNVDTHFSRQVYKCRVCDTEKRSDKLRNHYRKKVKFDETGKPIDEKSKEYTRLDEDSEHHIRCFRENEYSRDKLPPMKRPVSAPLDPCDSCSQQIKMLKIQSSSNNYTDDDADLNENSQQRQLELDTQFVDNSSEITETIDQADVQSPIHTVELELSNYSDDNDNSCTGSDAGERVNSVKFQDEAGGYFSDILRGGKPGTLLTISRQITTTTG